MTWRQDMKAKERLHALGQNLWLDNITRYLLTSGTLQRYIDELSVTCLTSNPARSPGGCRTRRPRASSIPGRTC